MRIEKRSLCVSLILLLGICAVASARQPWQLLLELPVKTTDVSVSAPIHLDADSESGRYYVVDAGRGQLVSFDREGKYLATFDAGGRLKTPVAMARTRTGKFWIVEGSSNKLLYVDVKGKKVRDFSLKYRDRTSLFPTRVALDAKGRLFVLDRRGGTVVRLDDNLKVVKVYKGPKGSRGLIDFKVKSDGIWALDGLNKRVYRFKLDGSVAETIPLKDELQFPVSLEVEGSGRIFVLDRHAGKVSVFNRRGEFKFDFLSRGKERGRLWYPAHLFFDGEDRLCIVDEGNARVGIYGRK